MAIRKACSYITMFIHIMPKANFQIKLFKQPKKRLFIEHSMAVELYALSQTDGD